MKVQNVKSPFVARQPYFLQKFYDGFVNVCVIKLPRKTLVPNGTANNKKFIVFVF